MMCMNDVNEVSLMCPRLLSICFIICTSYYLCFIINLHMIQWHIIDTRDSDQWSESCVIRIHHAPQPIWFTDVYPIRFTDVYQWHMIHVSFTSMNHVMHLSQYDSLMCIRYNSLMCIRYDSGAWCASMTHDSDHWCEWHMNHVPFVHIMHLICIQWIISATPLIDVRMIYTCWDVDISWYMSHHCIMCQWYAFVDIKHKSYDETQIIWWNTNNMKHKSYDVHMIKGGGTP